jgi:trehalose 6-phosphate phosphatase
VRTLVARAGATRALYAGDDTTDLDAFAGLDAAALEAAVKVAVASEEGPVELREAADVVVESTQELTNLLKLL